MRPASFPDIKSQEQCEFVPDPVPITDMPAGDVCDDDSECAGTMTCDREMCVMTGGYEGDPCTFQSGLEYDGAGNLECNVGFYCDKTNTCQPVAKENRPCDDDYSSDTYLPCGFGTLCALIPVDDATQPLRLCRALYSQPNG